MSRVKLVWVTPDTDKTITYIARSSNPDGQDKPIGGLLNYMTQHGHVSPFEMAGACIEINTTRDIGRQILSHLSFLFQEFSQCYQDVTALDGGVLREGLTPTRMYMSGTFRSWIHYLQSRLDPSTQAEHREVAQQVLTILRAAAPEVIGAFFPE